MITYKLVSPDKKDYLCKVYVAGKLSGVIKNYKDGFAYQAKNGWMGEVFPDPLEVKKDLES